VIFGFQRTIYEQSQIDCADHEFDVNFSPSGLDFNEFAHEKSIFFKK
jgi:hypothetical protein